MKKINLFSIIVTALLIATVSVVSCSKKNVREEIEGNVELNEKRTVKNISFDNLTPQQIAEYHNIAVELYLSKYGDEKHTIGEMVNAVTELMSIHHPELMNGNTIDDSDNILFPFYSEYDMDNDMLSYIVTVGLDAWVAKGVVSEYFAEGIKQLVRNKSTLEEAISWMNGYDIRVEYEEKCMDICRALLFASNSIWNEGVIDVPPTHMKCGHWAIFADAFVTLLASETGPGSVLLGGAASIAVDNVCP